MKQRWVWVTVAAVLALIGCVFYWFSLALFVGFGGGPSHGDNLSRITKYNFGRPTIYKKQLSVSEVFLPELGDAFWKHDDDCTIENDLARAKAKGREQLYRSLTNTREKCLLPSPPTNLEYGLYRQVCNEYRFENCPVIMVSREILEYPKILSLITKIMEAPCKFIPDEDKSSYLSMNCNPTAPFVSQKIILGLYGNKDFDLPGAYIVINRTQR